MKEVNFRLGELFSGPGGIALGALNSIIIDQDIKYTISHSWASDHDIDTCKTYTKNICNGNDESVFCEDVRTLDISKLSPIDAFAYGFPCNDFSILGESKGLNGSYGPLYSYGINILNKMKPKFFFAENVRGLRSANNGTALLKILRSLQNAGNGYILTTHLYKFEEYGVPQYRHRIIIIGIDKSFGLKFKVPSPTTPNKFVSVRHVLETNPIPIYALNNSQTSQSVRVTERLRHIRPGENAWTANIPEELKLNVKGAKLSHIYKRLDPDKPAYTITGSGGGGTYGYHWKEPRALTNRERARIQTFPDDFVFEGTKTSVRKQIGMAVSPKMSQIIFEAILKTFAGINYESVPETFNLQLLNNKL